MKFFALIMSMLVLGMMFAPCSDGQCSAKDKLASEISKSHSGQDHKDLDACSPFCSCSCCSSISVLLSADKTAQLLLPAAINIEAYFPENISSLPLPIWQPPQLTA